RPGDAPERSDDFDFLIANAVGSGIGWSFHRHQAKQLKEMILHHVAQRPGRFIITRPRFHSECLRRSDLEMIDVAGIPERLDNAVRGLPAQNVLRSLFAEKMVDPKGLTLVECLANDSIQFARRGKIGAEWFFDDNARPASFPGAIQSGGLQIFQDNLELVRPGREIEKAIAPRAPFVVDLFQSYGYRFVSVFVADLSLMIEGRLRKCLPDFIATWLAGKFVRCFLNFLAEVAVALRPARETDDRHRRRQFASGGKIVKRGNQFPMRQIAGGAEDHDRTRLRHGARRKTFA